MQPNDGKYLYMFILKHIFSSYTQNRSHFVIVHSLFEHEKEIDIKVKQLYSGITLVDGR